MGGGDAGLKAIAKKTKANGLGRLRWYCQMCEKQCRDENGFKCHTNTPAHQQQLVLFADQPDLFVDRFSNKFLADFLAILRQHGANAAAANNVYQEYIKEKHHVHMNSTRWTTLTEFVKDLGRRGICRVEYRDDALWIRYVDRDAVERKRRAQDMDRVRLDEEERAEQLLSRQMRGVRDEERALSNKPAADAGIPVDTTPVRLSMKNVFERPKRAGPLKQASNIFDELASTKRGDVAVPVGKREHSRKQTVLDEIIVEEKLTKPPQSVAETEAPVTSVSSQLDASRNHLQKCGEQKVHERTTYRPGPGDEPVKSDLRLELESDESPWIAKGIIVKCIADSLKGTEYYKKKGIVREVHDDFVATVELFEGGALLQLDQADLQTVIPKVGGKVLILHGKHKGCVAVVQSINETKYTVTTRAERETESDDLVCEVDYEHVSKLSTSDNT